ncbi:enhancer of polycomb-like-domain-containing protein [Absidia repens]|uniref:Enhancer of polycomb-like protein n=1 Tax=Absidia repens TaxID=90262 RepID=A0A1X2IZL4_9FUNG|nr:enhancer of polycomb-like-domain-containing protein [Absidia repens]
MVSRFRVKKLSPKHPLPIYKESQLPDLVDPANIIQRAVPQIETGVEKEEEEEHDLQAAISAAQAAVTTGVTVNTYIPTPDASSVIDPKEFSKMYKKKYKEPSTLIRFSSTVEDTTGCPYVMDEEDDTYYKKHRGQLSLSEDEFEKLMWEFETITNQQLPHLYLDVSHIPEYEDFLLLVPNHSIIHSWESAAQVYSHWKDRRVQRGGKSIIPVLAYEDVLKHEIDPYVCFRRRETKPVRKTRRTDQQSMERLRKLRSEMEMARNLLEMVLRREKMRKEGLVLEHSVFDKTCRAREYQRVLDIKDDEDFNQILSSKKKRKTAPSESGAGSGTTIKIPLSRLKRDAIEKLEKSPLQIQMEIELLRKRERDALYEDVTECPYQPFPRSIPSMFFQQLSLSSAKENDDRSYHSPPAVCGTRYRRRLGRGGRMFVDRLEPRRKETLPSSTSPMGGKNGNLPNFYEFDVDSESDESDDEFDVMDDKYLQHRTHILEEPDLRNLITVPFMQPFGNTMSNGRTQHQQKHLDQQQQQQQRTTAQNQTTNTPSTSSPSVTPNSANNALPSPPMSSPGSLKQQNINGRMTPQQVAAHMIANDTHPSNGSSTNAPS